MKFHGRHLPIFCVLLLCQTACAATPPACPAEMGIALQVLGSGGPIADDARASSAYIVWVDGKARALIDAGGGSFLRFGEAQAKFTDLDFVGLSHFHADHSADFPALLKSGNFSGRNRPLPVAGPSGSTRFPGLLAYLDSILSPDSGAYAYLSGYLDGSGSLAKLNAIEIGKDYASDQNLMDENSELQVLAMRVPHGIVPAVAFRVDVRGQSIVFASDQNGSDDDFAAFAKNATILVMHMPIPEDADDGARQLHAVPSRIAVVAKAANAERLLLSHFMARSLRNIDENVQLIQDGYDGDLLLAGDLMCKAIL